MIIAPVSIIIKSKTRLLKFGLFKEYPSPIIRKINAIKSIMKLYHPGTSELLIKFLRGSAIKDEDIPKYRVAIIA